MMGADTDFEIVNRHGDTIYATLTWPEADKPLALPLPLVIVFHGFRGFRNWGFLPTAAHLLAKSGMLVVRMDFSKNGMRGTAERMVSPSDFASNTLSREIEDVADLVTYLKESDDAIAASIRDAWNGALNFVGHSRGGGIAMMAGVEHEARHVVVWNSVGKWGHWTPRQREEWMRTNPAYVLDIENNRSRLSLVEACRFLSERLLFVHAENDLTVPLKQVQSLIGEAGGRAELSVVSNTSHTFGAEHPFEGITPALTSVLEHTTNFLNDRALVAHSSRSDV